MKLTLRYRSETDAAIFTTPTTLPIKKATRLDIRSRSPSPTVSTPGSNVKMRKNKIDASEEYNKIHSGSQKNLINLVVVGHVDSGKSTLMGHLLVELGQVSSKMMHKYEQESRKLGKQSFAFAWVLDETSEERNRGITMDVGQNYFETKNKAGDSHLLGAICSLHQVHMGFYYQFVKRGKKLIGGF